jgi:Cu2+-exporting ATPase
MVLEGTADVDESLITGESRAIPKAPGAAVVGGTIAEGGSLRVRVKAIGEETAISGIMRLVAAAQASGSRAQALADRAAALLFYIAVAAGTFTFVYWWLAGNRRDALIRTATVLVIACPHALGLAIPLAIAISTAIGARNGLLVKDRLALERARNLDVVIFDKTGNYDDPYRIVAVVECDWMSQFAVSFVADIFPKTSRAGTTVRWRRSRLLGRAGSNRSPRDEGSRDRTTMR